MHKHTTNSAGSFLVNRPSSQSHGHLAMRHLSSLRLFLFGFLSFSLSLPSPSLLLVLAGSVSLPLLSLFHFPFSFFLLLSSIEVRTHIHFARRSLPQSQLTFPSLICLCSPFLIPHFSLGYSSLSSPQLLSTLITASPLSFSSFSSYIFKLIENNHS